MSRETDAALEQARGAAADWRAHRNACPKCTTAVRARKTLECCAAGRPLLAAKRNADIKLSRNRELDRQPTPGQLAIPGLEKGDQPCMTQ